MQYFNAKTLAALVMSVAFSGCAAGAVDLGGRNRDGGVTDGASSGGPDGSRPPDSESCNGADDDLDTRIDEGCSCESGQTQACFGGEPSRRGVGACRDGVQTCTAGEFADWGNFACAESVAPVDEQCGDGVDNDCDGEVDEDCGPRTLRAYIKASNTDSDDRFGGAIAISANGKVLAIAASFEDSSGRNTGGDQADNSAPDSGAVYVFRRAADGWVQEAYIKAFNTDAHDRLGGSVSLYPSTMVLNADGTVLAIGAASESSISTDHQEDNSVVQSGAVYVYRWHAGVWTPEAYLKASSVDARDHFGASVSLSGDGDILAVGAPQEDSSARGIDGDSLDNGFVNSGAVYVYRYSAGAWRHEAYIKASNTTNTGAYFGYSVRIANDGNVLAVGAPEEASSARGIDGDQSDLSAWGSGAVYVFRRSASAWTQEAYIKASNTDTGDHFARHISLSADGTLLVVGAPGEDSATRDINADQHDNSASESGAVYVFARSSEGRWSQECYLKASNADAGDGFGSGLSLSGDGFSLAVGAPNERSIDGDQTNNAGEAVGAVYVFERSESGLWTQTSYVKAFNADNNDDFGVSVALDHSGATLAVGASGEASSGRGLDADPEDNSIPSAGAVYVYH